MLCVCVLTDVNAVRHQGGREAGQWRHLPSPGRPASSDQAIPRAGAFGLVLLIVNSPSAQPQFSLSSASAYSQLRLSSASVQPQLSLNSASVQSQFTLSLASVQPQFSLASRNTLRLLLNCCFRRRMCLLAVTGAVLSSGARADELACQLCILHITPFCSTRELYRVVK